MLQHRLHETVAVPYTVSLSQNNLSVACRKNDQYEVSLIHKYGVVTGNQAGFSDALKKPWPNNSTVPTGALMLSVVIFQTKTFIFDEKPVLVVLSTRGPFICFGGELECFPGLGLNEVPPNAEWSIFTCVAILGDNMICIGNCKGQIQITCVDEYNIDNLRLCHTVITSNRSKVLLLSADKNNLVAADSLGKIWSWYLDEEKLVAFLKGVHSGMTALINAMQVTGTLIALGFANGLLRLLSLETGALYCDIHAHSSAISAMAFNAKSQVLLTVGEDAYIRVWAIDEQNEETKIQYLQHEIVDDMMLCGVQFLNDDGTAFGVVGYDRNELIIFKA